MTRTIRSRAWCAVTLGVLISSAAYAQAPLPGPLVLDLPSSPRTTALGNAWVAGRDSDVIFYNPAQLVGVRPSEFMFAIARNGPSSKHVTMGSTYAAGKWSLTLGWGVQFVDFHADAAAASPLPFDTVLARGPANGSSELLVVGGAIVVKGFRIGASGKYAADRVTPIAGAGGFQSQAILADLGVAHNLFRGVIAASVQNLGHAHDALGATAPIPTQVRFGWSTTRAAGPLDLGIYSQGTVRSGWVSPAGGLDVGYSWIEGYSASLRVGAARREMPGEWPVAFGAAFTADRLTVEYGVQIFQDRRAINGVTVRWR